MENNFDKFFKDKLEHREFEMKPEFWEGAEALIEADKKSGYWRGFIIWFGVALVAGLSVFFIWKNNTSNPIVEAEKNSSPTLENSLAPTIEKDKKELEISTNKISEENISEGKNESTEIDNNNNSLNVIPSTSNKTVKNSNADLKNTKQSDIDSDVFSKTIPSNSSDGDLTRNNNSSEINNNNTITNPSGIISNEENSSNQTIDIPVADFKEKENEGDQNSTIKTETAKEKIESVKREDETTVQPIASSSTILLPFLELLLANNNKIEKLDLETVCPFTPARDKFVFGGFLGATSYPSGLNNSSETAFIGGKTGLFIEQNFEIGKAKIALGAELAYHYRDGNFVKTKENEVTSYSFGRTVAQAKLTPENLHYLELPLYLKYQRKKMTFETGASFNYLLGVRGKVIDVDQTTQTGWIPNLGFKKNHVNVLLGFHYRFSHNLHFGIRANYTPNGILDEEVILPDGLTVALQESKPFYLTVRITQYLKFKR